MSPPEDDLPAPIGEVKFSPESLGRLGDMLGVLRALGMSGAAGAGGDPPERRFGRFRLRGVLGQGKFGVVFLADDPQAGRPVALKLPQAAALVDPAMAERFGREVEAVVHLDHAGIVPVLEAGAVASVAYIVMPVVEGPTLAAWLARRPEGAPVAEAIELLLALSDAVGHAHERGVLHCDLKPANVLLSRRASGQLAPANEQAGRLPYDPRITDFGLARLLFRPLGETQTHLSAGTPPYMAPEQARGVRRDLTARCDVHALAAILYELLTGTAPYEGEDSLERLLDHDARPAAPRSLRPGLPRDLEAIVLKGLEKDPSNRYHSARALGDDLRRFQAGRPTLARPLGPAGVAWRWVRRKPTAAALLAVAGLASVLLGWMAMHLGFAAQRADYLEVAAGLERVRQRRMERPERWADDNLADVRKLAAMGPAAYFQEPLRTEVAHALIAPQLRLVRELAPGKNVFVTGFSPGGQTLALGERYPVLKGQLRVWLMRLSGEITGELRYPVDEVWEGIPGNKWADGARSVAFSPDGRWLVLGTRSGRLVRWDLGAPNTVPLGPAVWVMDAWDAKNYANVMVHRLMFTHDGSMLLAGSNTGLCRTWDVRQGWKAVNGGLARLPANTTPAGELVSTFEWHPKLSLDHNDPRTGRRHSFGHDNLSTKQFCVSPDGRRLAAEVGGDRPRWLIRTDNPADRRPLVQPDLEPCEKVQDLGFSPDGRWLWFTSENPTGLELWDAVRGTLVARRGLQGGSGRLAVSPDGRHVAVCEQERTLLFELAPSPVRGSVCEPGTVRSFALAGDGARLATVCEDLPNNPHANAWHWPVTLHQRTRQGFAWQRYLCPPHAGQEQPTVAFSPKGDVLMTVGAGDGIGLRSLDGGGFSTAPGRLDDLRVGPDGRVWAVVSGKLLRWSENGKLEVVYERPPREEEGDPARGIQPGLRGVLFLRRDGQVAWFDDRDQLAAVWRVFDDQKASSLAWSADGEEALVGGNLGGVARLKLPTGDVVRLPEPHRNTVVGLAYLPGGVTLTASADSTVRFWDRKDRPLFALREAGPIVSVAASPGGRELFVHARGEWGVRVWDLAELAAQFRRLGLDPGFTVGDAPSPTDPAPGLDAQLFGDQEHRNLLDHRRDHNINFDWGLGPHSFWNWQRADNLSIRWTGKLRAPKPGRWELRLDCDEAASVWIDGRHVLRNPASNTPSVAVIDLPARPVSFRLDYSENEGPAHCKLLWRPEGSTGPLSPVPPEAFSTAGEQASLEPAHRRGLVADLFGDEKHTYLLERRRDARVNFNWADQSPSPWVGPDHFSIRWTGWLRVPQAGDWEFCLDADDGAKFWLDGRLVMDHPKAGINPQQHTKVVSLSAKPVSFRLDYHEVTGQAHCQLMWRPAGSKDPFLPVPPEAFSPH